MYPLSAIRYFSSSNLVTVATATAEGFSRDLERIDRAMRAHLLLESSVEADMFIDLGMPGWGPFHLIPRMPKCNLHLALEGGTIGFFNFIMPTAYHSITIEPRGQERRTEKVYGFEEGPGQEWWSTLVLSTR